MKLAFVSRRAPERADLGPQVSVSSARGDAPMQTLVSRRPLLLLAAVAAATVVAAPAAAAPLPGAPACPLFPRTNVLNKPVYRLPVASNSAAVIASIGLDDRVHADFGSGLWNGRPIGIPITVVGRAQRKSAVEFEYADESDRGPYPIPDRVRIEGGRRSSGDRHAIIVERDTCRLYELFALYPRWRAGSGAIWSLRSNRLRPSGWTSADAAGLPILPGLVRYDEVRRGVIDHALRFTVSRTRRAYVYPARHFASSLTDPDLPPMGLRLRLRAELPAPGARHPDCAEALRDDRRGQRLRLVHLRRARPALGHGPAPHAPPCQGLRLRRRRHAPPTERLGRSACDTAADLAAVRRGAR